MTSRIAPPRSSSWRQTTPAVNSAGDAHAEKRYWSSVKVLDGISRYIPDKSEVCEDWERAGQYLEEIDSQIAGGPSARDKATSMGGNQHKRYCLTRRLAMALAQVGCEKEGPEHVFACGIEQVHHDGEDTSRNRPEYIIRVARNAKMTEEDVRGFQAFIDATVELVLGIDQILPAKDSTDYKDMIESQRSCLLKSIIERCESKIKSLYKQPLQRWIDDLVKSTSTASGWLDLVERYYSSADGNRWLNRLRYIAKNTKKKGYVVLQCHDRKSDFRRVRLPETGFKGSNNPPLQPAINSAEESNPVSLLDDLDRMWKDWEGPQTLPAAGEDNAAEVEILGKEDLKRSAIYQYLNKLRRYYIASTRLIKYPLKMKRKNFLHKRMFTVKMVSGFETTRTGKDENEYTSLGSFLSTFGDVGIDLSRLEADKIQKIKDTWTRDLHQPRVLHCEMQLVVFYLLNPGIVPIGSFIAVSKFCCFMCNLVIKLLSQAMLNNIYGNPIEYSVAGTHGKFSSNWLFPTLGLIVRHSPITTEAAGDTRARHFDTCNDHLYECPSIPRDEYKQLVARLDAVAQELSAHLQRMLRRGLSYILKTDLPSNSEGLSSSGDEADKATVDSDPEDAGQSEEFKPLRRHAV